VGERGREVQEFVERTWARPGSGLVVVSTSDQPALVRLKEPSGDRHRRVFP
jgi:flagellar biosynthesis/type III secretory pathway ATPase